MDNGQKRTTIFNLLLLPIVGANCKEQVGMKNTKKICVE